jgi:hypothetical protein
VWRKLKDLGALYIQDGVATLPEDADTREQLEWLQLRVREAGGEATLWEARPGTAAEEAELVETFRSSREEAYGAIIAEAERLRRKAQMGGGELMERLGKLEREFRAERRRDYFRSPLRLEAASALKAAREAVRGREGAAGPQAPKAGADAVGNSPGLPRGPHRLHLADKALRRSGGFLRLLQRSGGSPGGGRTL